MINDTQLQYIAESIVNDMMPYLDSVQTGHLREILNINLHALTEAGTELSTDLDSDEFIVKMYIASKRASNRSKGTLDQYAREIKNLLIFLDKPLADITAMDIRYYISYIREKKGLSSVTVRNRVTMLGTFWEFLVTEGYAKSNVVRQIGNIKMDKTIKKPFSHSELEALRSACTNRRDRAIIEFLYSTGVRVSEMVSVNAGDINYQKQELIVLGKGSKERTTYLTDACMFYLKLYLDERAGETDILNAPLFVTLDAPHERIKPEGVRRMLTKLGKSAGVPDCHPHRFRRTIATDLLSHGMPIEQVKEFLGHEQIDTTMIYCTVDEEQVKSSHKKYA